MVMLALYQGPLVLEESAAENAASIGQQPAGQVQSANQHHQEQHDNPPATAFWSAPTRLSARPTLGMFHFGREPEPWRSGGPEVMPGYHRRWGKLVKETSRTTRFRFEKQPSKQAVKRLTIRGTGYIVRSGRLWHPTADLTCIITVSTGRQVSFRRAVSL